jgi:acyl carrier protein
MTKERLFRTYDLGRIRICNSTGLLEILGRKDSQVKVNGFRIELGEVEQTFQKHKNVQSVAAKVHENVLYAYVVHVKPLKQSVNDFINDLNDWCRESLPDYMIPNRIIVLEELPLSPNGKVLRENLNPPIGDSFVGDPNRRIDDIEISVRNLFSQILNVESASLFSEVSNFFSLGGTSVSAIQLMYHIKKMYLVAVTVGELFSNPTVEGISNLVRSLIQVPIAIQNSTLMKSYKLSSGRCDNCVTLVMMVIPKFDILSRDNTFL